MLFPRITALALLFEALFSLPSFAAELPISVAEYLQEKGNFSSIEAFRKIPVVTVERFVKEFTSDEPVLLSGGYFGLVFLGKKSGDIYKISHVVFAKLGLTDLNPERTTVDLSKIPALPWTRLSAKALNSAESVYRQYGLPMVGGVSVMDELVGEAIWSVYSGEKPVFAHSLTQDGLALRRSFIKGTLFSEILRSDRSGTALAKDYKMDSLWAQLVKFQRRAERMIFYTGVAIDQLTPTNFLVQGKGAEAKLIPFDTGIVEPSSEAARYYRIGGIQIPQNIFKNALSSGTVWPIVPEHIVYSKTWDLNLAQALSYFQALRKTTLLKALEDIAFLRVLPFPAAPHLVDRKNIDECRKALAEL